MLERFASSDIEVCAQTVARLGGDQPDPIRASLAWMIRNRLRLGTCARQTMPDISRACQDILREAVGDPRQIAVNNRLSTADWCRVYAINCLVWAGDVDDQTGGAISCHRHDIIRAWARNRTPTALLGPYIFFR